MAVHPVQPGVALWSVQDKTVIEDNTQEYSNQDKIAVKAAMQQIVISMGGKLE